MREPKEVERLRLAETPSMSIRNFGSAKLDEPRLVGMKGEPEACEPCLEIGKEPLCLVLMLKADDMVSRAAEFHHRALAEPDVRLAPHPAPIVRPRPYRSLQ